MNFDVIILGAGLAGGFLARQLTRAHPKLKILQLEATEQIDRWKVGEATVELAARYMVNTLGLQTYLYQHQLPKNGLRYFYDSKAKDLPLTRMSEMGTDHLPHYPSFQLNRATLEADLATMNAAAGVDLRLGAKVTDLEVDRERGHRVCWTEKGVEHEARARWLLDASGRRHLVGRKVGLKTEKETRLNTGAAWARYTSVRSLDAFDDHAWRDRVHYTARYLSTTHFMYDGYWIWYIPLAGDLVSWGVVFDKDRISDGPRTQEELTAFLAKHRFSAELLDGARVEDFGTFAHLPFFSDRYFSEDRWALTGEAGAFTDPFYSPGSDFISTANEFITSLITSDLAGDEKAFQRKLKAYNDFYRYKYEMTIRIYIKMYPIMGSYEIFRLRYLWDFNAYFNLTVWPYFSNLLTDVDFLERDLQRREEILAGYSHIADRFAEMGEYLRSIDEYHVHNEGGYARVQGDSSLPELIVGRAFDFDARRERWEKINSTVLAAVERTLRKATTPRPMASAG